MFESRPARLFHIAPLRILARWGLRLSGWRLEGELPPVPKYVAIGAPHTSNWDFVLMLAAVILHDIEFVWLGKHTLFRGPLGMLFRRLGGIAVDRTRPTGMVTRATAVFQQYSRVAMVITPEGTRKQVAWKKGFYYVAHGAGVPILLAYIDHRHKTLGIGPLFTPSGDVEADMARIRAFYACYRP